MADPKPGLYRHYKNRRLYKLIGVAKHSEDISREFVVYQALYKSELGNKVIFVRPKKMFFDRVIVDGKKVPRFEYVGKKVPRSE